MERSDRDTDGPGKMDLKLSYTGSKNEDRAAFIRHFVDYVEKVKRSHESKVRRQMKTAAFRALTVKQKQTLRDSKPDYRYIWDLIPSMLAGEDFATSPAYEWWCAAYEKEGMVASTAFQLEAKFLMRGTKEKKDLLVAKPLTVEQDGLTYSKLCMRREAAVNAGTMVEDSMTRQNIEECIKLLRIREYKERVSDQLRVQFPAPTKVTWKNLEVIVELGIYLPEVVAAIRRSSAAKKADAGDRRKDFKKKEPAAPAGEEAPKKPTREAHNAERAKNSYNKVPPPDAKKDKRCKYCFTQMWHSPDRCFTGSRDAYVPQDFYKKRLHSVHEHEVNNAKMRESNIKHMFFKHKMGITTEEWLKLPEAKQQRAAASAEALSEEDEVEYDSNCNQREEYAAVDGTSSAGEEEVTNDHSEDGSMPELQARAAVALGNTQKMQGFPVKTPEEFDKEAHVPRAVPANFLSRKMHLMASLLRSCKQTYTQIAATMVAEGTIHLPKNIDTLLALEEIEGRGSSEPVDQAAAGQRAPGP
ncbi:hypothetical protein CYMTET_25900 [Cymbomonas tetramitiformis]|uniref:Uncharacterized protein n=1 Tax=Cymbomonas tetramitiformis TaxID=36881 RepID=A0AAE0CFQ0_9CHLO|nr:hypothetical protein CYMTET_37278 [Cymbomonas tetramitiformis]KAK3265415.1 hypothetical protein CYMTET_25900 [Cymbomonas tetramitiformis]